MSSAYGGSWLGGVYVVRIESAASSTAGFQMPVCTTSGTVRPWNWKRLKSAEASEPSGESSSRRVRWSKAAARSCSSYTRSLGTAQSYHTGGGAAAVGLRLSAKGGE